MMLFQFSGLSPEAIDLQRLAIDLGLVLLFGHLLGWHFIRFAQVVGNKRKLARVFVFVAATTLLIITVVKTSLALSLGLVGALSIIRFRTPVKEPEELAYLFLAIALGVGLGADRWLETSLVFGVVMIVMALRAGLPGGKLPLRSVLQIAVPGATAGGDTLEKLMPAVTRHCRQVDLRRVDSHDGEFHASLLVDLESLKDLEALLDGVAETLPEASVSVVERDTLD